MINFRAMVANLLLEDANSNIKLPDKDFIAALMKTSLPTGHDLKPEDFKTPPPEIDDEVSNDYKKQAKQAAGSDDERAWKPIYNQLVNKSNKKSIKTPTTEDPPTETSGDFETAKKNAEEKNITGLPETEPNPKAPEHKESQKDLDATNESLELTKIKTRV